MTDNRTMTEMLRAPIEGCAEAIVVPSILVEQFELKHSLINMMTSEKFFGLEKDNPHDHIRWFNKITSTIKYKDVPNSVIKLILFPFSIARAARRWLEKERQHSITTWDDLVSKFFNELFPPSRTTNLPKLTHAVNQQTSAVTTAMTAMLKQLQANPPPAQVKAVEEICVTCGGAHLYYQCLTAGGNTFPEFRDNIYGYVSAAACNYNQGNPGFNRDTNFNQEQPYQATTQSNQNSHLNELEKIKMMNDVSMKAMQNQIDMVKNEIMNEIKTSIQTSLSNQTNEIKKMMASLLQVNTASTSGLGSLPGNTVANPKGELNAITTRSGLVTDRPTVPTPPKSVTPEEEECVEETYTNPDLAEYTIKVPPPPVQKPKLLIQRRFVLHTKDSPLPNIPSHAKIPKNAQSSPLPLNENCSAVILKKLPEKLGDLGKFLIPCGFSELKCKSLADLGASINLMPLSVWKKLGLPNLIPTRMTLELANREICTPDGIARDVFVPVGKFTFPADFVVVDYESDPKVSLILGRSFLRTARALIDVHGEEMIHCDGDERFTLNMKHDTTSYSNHPHRESANLINIFNISKDFLEVLVSNKQSDNPTFLLHKEITSPEVTHEIHDSKGCNFLSKELLDIDSFNDIHPHFDDNPLSGSTTYSSNSLLEEFTDELALITYPPDYDDNLTCDSEFDLREIEFLLYQEYDSFASQYFSKDDDLPSPDNEDKVFNPGILIHEKSVTIITRVAQEKKLAIFHASLVFEDFDPLFYEPLVFKDVLNSMRLLLFSFKNEEKVFKPGIYNSKKLKIIQVLFEFTIHCSRIGFWVLIDVNEASVIGLYTPTTVVVPTVPATNDSPTVPEHTIVETPMNMSLENKAHYESEKEAIHLILTGIGGEIYSTIDACKTAQEIWEAIERLQQGESLNIQDVKTNLFWEFGKFTSHDGETMESYYTRFYKLMNEMLRNNLTVATMQVNVQFLQQLQPEWSRTARNANPLALVATTQPNQDPYYQTSKPHKSYAPTSKASIPTKSHTTTRNKGKEIAKPITPPFKSASEEDSDPEQAQRDKDVQKNLALIAKYFKKIYTPINNNLITSLIFKNKNVGTTPSPLVQQTRYSVSTARNLVILLRNAESQEGLKTPSIIRKRFCCANKQRKVQYNDEYNVFANMNQHCEQSKSTSNTCLVEKDDSDVTPDSSDICEHDIQTDQNAEDEHDALANLIANLKLDVDENKKIQKQLKKANTSLSHCKTLEESNSVRDSCLVTLQTKQTEFEKYKACNDRTVDYNKLECKLNETLGLLAQKDIDIKEGLKLKAYKILVLKEKHDDLVKQGLLTKSHYEGLVKEKIKNVQLIIFIVDSGCMKHMTGNLKLLCNFVEKYIGTVRFGNDQFTPIIGYGDLGNDLLTSNRGSDLYTISLQETTSSTPLCLMAKASPTQAWLWHRRLSHLNFDYINLISKKDVMISFPKLKYVKDQLCSSCEVSKVKRSSFKLKSIPSSKGRFNLLHMDLCSSMQVASINRKKGTKFLNKTLHAFFKEEGIEHQTSTPRTPKQNGVIERRNRTLVEVARTMLSASKLPLFFWGEAITTTYKMKEKRDQCILVGYSTQSKGYRVYNKRTRLIVESTHLRFDEIIEMYETSVANDTSGLVP
uniref:Integrase catalytic domain-containing protein n=1 Tax=Tanacetum cinerariifolium TaxID=118510 RepID=A0A6L2JYL1_TANCI|nr:hypothetical protein [Tanacetum cinerariifolium]